VAANAHVVPNLDLIIDLSARTNPGRSKSCSINTGVCSYLNPVTELHVSDLGYGPKTFSRLMQVTKTVSPNHCSVLQHHVAADHAPLAYYRSGMKNGPVADLSARVDRYVGMNYNIGTNDHPRANHRKSPN
jgi:hypothetical protein